MKEIFKRATKEQLSEQKSLELLKAIPERDAYSRKEAARKLCISVRKLDYLISEGKIRAGKCGSRVLIPAQEIDSYLGNILGVA